MATKRKPSRTIIPIYVEIDNLPYIDEQKQICRLEGKLHGRDGFVFVTGSPIRGVTLDQFEKFLKAEGRIRGR